MREPLIVAGIILVILGTSFWWIISTAKDSSFAYQEACTASGGTAAFNGKFWECLK